MPKTLMCLTCGHETEEQDEDKREAMHRKYDGAHEGNYIDPEAPEWQ
jgi:hypothetical protein